MMAILLLMIGSAYLAIIVALIVGLLRSVAADRPDRSPQPFVSVLIPARDEEATVRACLESVRDQTYPRDRYEVILIDDHSSDGTARIACELQPTFPHLRIIVPKESSDLTGRSNALAQGIDVAKGEIFLMTDADCVVPSTWVEGTTARFTDGVGVVGGLTVQRSSNWLEGMQSLDWSFLLGIAAATVGLRLPLSIIGNNFSIHRRAYDDVGGFRRIKNSVTEDFQLFKAVVNTGRWGYRFMVDPATTNVTRPCPTIREVIEQKHRWGRGGLDLNWLGYTLIIVAYLMHAALAIAAFTDGGAFWLWWVLKVWGDLTFVGLVLARIGRLRDLRHILSFELYYPLYVLLMPLRVLLVRDVVWKGRAYQTNQTDGTAASTRPAQGE
jgi:cellulose synthase/poly-beta-1,6-N-acetylglucosamine synthase-like glycosyltransferase